LATSIIPKSVFRRNDNITVGYGTVPAIEIEGVIGWGLPGGHVVFTEREATAFATQLDKDIQARLRHPGELLTSTRGYTLIEDPEAIPE
jgi:hypothetical protein